MPKLIYSNEKFGCGATIALDSGDVCIVSVAQAGVLVRSYKQNFIGRLLGSFIGTKLYEEKNVYKAAFTAQALSAAYSLSRNSTLRILSSRLSAGLCGIACHLPPPLQLPSIT